ncbi:MAG: AAA family ATPase [Ignavibacteria bacterium]|nr:AAA family ATPase [Ignavibacteria bacterium]
MSKKISVCLPKGGVGKTTTAVNLAASLAVAEKKTLLIDVDPYGASAIALGYTSDKINAGLSEVFAFTHSLKSAIHRTELEYLDFVPSNVYSIHIHDKYIKYSDNRLILKNAVSLVEDFYDFIVIDCPPLLKGITTNALVASDSILIPIKSGHFSLEAVDTLFKYFEHLKEIANPHLTIEGIILTMYEKDSKVTKISERELKIKYSKYLLNTVIPNTNLLNESTFYGKPLCLYKINSEGAIAYLNLANEIIKNNKVEEREVV